MESPVHLPRLSPGGSFPAFPDAAVFPLRQYRPAEALGTGAGTVRAGWRGSSLCLRADLDRPSPSTLSTADHQPIWTLGDCFEIFLKRLDDPAYIEFHVSPAGHVLQLRFPSLRTPEQQRLPIAETLRQFSLPGRRFRAEAGARPDGSGWTAGAEIDLAALGMAAGDLAGERFAFSFCACNFTRRPLIYMASTSPLERMDFHLHSQWRQMECGD